jgi:hypothetical protein
MSSDVSQGLIWAAIKVCAASKVADAGFVWLCFQRSIEFRDSLRVAVGNSCKPHGRLAAMSNPE